MFGADAIFPALVILLVCGAISVAALLGIIFGLFCVLRRRRTLGLVLVVPSVGWLWLLFCLLSPAFAPHHQGHYSAGTIDLRQGDNLKMIFNGGLRPFRLQGLESNCCVLDSATITVIVPRASPFTIKVDRASIDVLDRNQIASIDLFGVDTSVPEAVALTQTICKAWNVSTTGLDDAVAHLGTMPDTGKGWGTEFNQPKIRARVVFRPLYYNPLFHFNNVGGHVNIALILGDHFNGVKFLAHPIQPPPGYESFSMNPPPRVRAFPSLKMRIRIFILGICGLFLIVISLGLVEILRSRRLPITAPEK